MKTFQWNPLFETGLAEIDTQHRRLVELVNDLGERIDSGQPEHIDQTLTALAEYTVYHFGSEESLMEASGVAAEHANHHRETHRRFVAQVTEWMQTRQAQGQLSPGQLLDYLANWLIFHILGDDQSLGRQILSIRSGMTASAAYASDRSSDDPRTDILLSALRRLYADLVERNERLVDAQCTLQELNASLEQRVNERTAELQAANQQLQEEQQRTIDAEKMASLGRMVAGFAHEVNTPVGVAIGAVSQTRQVTEEFNELLQQDEVSEQEVKQRLSVLVESSDLALSNLRRAAELVHSFKRTAVDQSSDIEREFDLAELIDDVLRNLGPLFKHTPVGFSVNCPAQLFLYGVPGALTQVLTNLCTNALMHAYADGARKGTISISAKVVASDLVLHFADDGCGIDAATVGKIFEPFYTTRRNTGGSGLGLYITYNLLQQLGGSIECHSEPGQGTEFIIRFPVRRQSTGIPS
jgi:hemerythrin-like metal-binding protein